MALRWAQQEQCPLLTGDKDLRQAAEAEKVKVKGTLWLVEALVLQHIINIQTAKHSYEQMEANGRRLPWKQAHQRLNELEGKPI